LQESDAPAFNFDFDIEVFEKAGVAPEKARRIGGFVSTSALDKQGERVLQEGLDFSPFLQDGWFNDNHSKATADIVGFPETAKLIRKGERLPSGTSADKTGWFVEGYLLQGHPPSDRIWELAKALQKTPRRLGFSVEGRVTQRMNKAGEPIVARAVVKNVAVTNCPVNNQTSLEVLAKSLSAIEMSKALEVGPPPGPASDPGSIPAGVPLSGMGAGRVLMPESIGGYAGAFGNPNGAQPRKKKKKKLTKSAALDLIHSRYPGITNHTAARIFRFAVAHASH
jgi:hypothetical protein